MKTYINTMDKAIKIIDTLKLLKNLSKDVGVMLYSDDDTYRRHVNEGIKDGVSICNSLEDAEIASVPVRIHADAKQYADYIMYLISKSHCRVDLSVSPLGEADTTLTNILSIEYIGDSNESVCNRTFTVHTYEIKYQHGGDVKTYRLRTLYTILQAFLIA